MSAIGRNDPCPCGSGKKYKRCCLGKDAPAPGAWTTEERDSALASLMRFAQRAELDRDRAAAELTFWGKRLERMTPAEARETMDFEQSRFGFHEWLVFDCPIHGGGTIVERFLTRAGSGLRSGERRYLERMRLSHLRPYEVQAVQRDQGLDLLDLWANQRVRVRERLGTRQLVQWDILAARVILGAEGEPVLDGSPYLYPTRNKEIILRVLKRLGRSLRGKLPRRDDATFFKNIGMVYHDLWLEIVAHTAAAGRGDRRGRRVRLRPGHLRRARPRGAARRARQPPRPRPRGRRQLRLARGESRESSVALRLGRSCSRRAGSCWRRSPRSGWSGAEPSCSRLAGAAVRFRLIEYEDPERALERVARSPARAAWQRGAARGRGPDGRRVLRAALPPLA